MGWHHLGYLGMVWEKRVLAGCSACRCAVHLARLKSDDYTCRTVRKRLMDGGSNPPSSTIHGGQIFSVPLFLSRKALFLWASASFLADVAGQISLVLSSGSEFLSFFSPGLWTCPWAEPSIHAGFSDRVEPCRCM